MLTQEPLQLLILSTSRFEIDEMQSVTGNQAADTDHTYQVEYGRTQSAQLMQPLLQRLHPV